LLLSLELSILHCYIISSSYDISDISACLLNSLFGCVCQPIINEYDDDGDDDEHCRRCCVSFIYMHNLLEIIHKLSFGLRVALRATRCRYFFDAVISAVNVHVPRVYTM